MADTDERLRAVARARTRIAAALTMAMIVLYFGFVALIAFSPSLLARKLSSGMSLGILLGAMVIVVSWLLTWVYVRWANAHYDTAIRAIGDESK